MHKQHNMATKEPSTFLLPYMGEWQFVVRSFPTPSSFPYFFALVKAASVTFFDGCRGRFPARASM